MYPVDAAVTTDDVQLFPFEVRTVKAAVVAGPVAGTAAPVAGVTVELPSEVSATECPEPRSLTTFP